MRLASLLGSFLFLAACANSGTGVAPPETVGKVDLERYQGTWYELARLPMHFQKECIRSEANYQLRPDGDVSVTNRCVDDKGKWHEVTGVAQPQEKGRTDRLLVNFQEGSLLGALAKGEYWILYLDNDYQRAVVGDSHHNYLWLLSRNTQVEQDDLNEMLLAARKQGYKVDDLIWRTPDSDQPSAKVEAK